MKDYHSKIPRTPIVVFDCEIQYAWESNPDKHYFAKIGKVLPQDIPVMQWSILELKTHWKLSTLIFRYKDPGVLDVAQFEKIFAWHEWEDFYKKKFAADREREKRNQRKRLRSAKKPTAKK
jgi:hypothetical protein